MTCRLPQMNCILGGLDISKVGKDPSKTWLLSLQQEGLWLCKMHLALTWMEAVCQLRSTHRLLHALIAYSGEERRLCGDLTGFHNKQAARVGSIHCYVCRYDESSDAPHSSCCVMALSQVEMMRISLKI